jgi:hypothetical protein
MSTSDWENVARCAKERCAEERGDAELNGHENLGHRWLREQESEDAALALSGRCPL